MADKLLTRRVWMIVLALVPVAAVAVVILVACGRVVKDDKFSDVTLDGKKFHLELALEPEKRFKGLSGRTEIPAEGGMLFVFPQPLVTAFVMRDCPIPIDIIFLDGTGRITAMHKMLREGDRSEEEKVLDANGINQKYEDRLKKYPSKFAAQFVIELKGNTLDTLKLKEGQKIELDIPDLKKRAK
jgi:uncharacterized membrane protein (UPF0127 family)